MYYNFKIHREKKGYWAECTELEGCHTQADTMPELLKNMEEALNLFLDEPPSSDHIFKMPKKAIPRGKEMARVYVRPSVALAMMLRQARLGRHLTQKDAALAIGIRGSLFGYQRLEKAKTANPTLDTLAKIKMAFPEVSIDDMIGLVTRPTSKHAQ